MGSFHFILYFSLLIFLVFFFPSPGCNVFIHRCLLALPGDVGPYKQLTTSRYCALCKCSPWLILSLPKGPRIKCHLPGFEEPEMTGWLGFRTSNNKFSLLGVRHQGPPLFHPSFKWANSETVKDCEWTFLKKNWILGKNPGCKPLVYLISLGVFV